MGSMRSGCVAYDESHALHMIVTCAQAHTVSTRLLCCVMLCCVTLCVLIFHDSVCYLYCVSECASCEYVCVQVSSSRLPQTATTARTLSASVGMGTLAFHRLHAHTLLRGCVHGGEYLHIPSVEIKHRRANTPLAVPPA